MSNIGYFSMYSERTKTYIGYGTISNYIFYLPKGFTLFSERQNLFLSNYYVDYERGVFSGYFWSADRPDVRMATDGEVQLGYRIPG